ncbi:capsule biosynthesis protein [Psychromonas algicola]|uniref:capsule biosynthesis protein n=1 Tax=Psychromonas algicola TaxID=2555642 RepID=UPI001067FFCF|nr:capsular biosynthesis protein [Psychromonas sp. RZ5]TEW52319.1 capsular biosynthesis protein [Psychromonas sp. RZ5]
MKMKNILFLQGPLGPFFKKFAHYVSAQGHQTYKINFNGGDRHYSGADHVFEYVDESEKWHAYLSDFIKEHSIATVIVYGDCRFYHKIAKQVATECGIDFWALEEGYLRMGFVTLEKDGCNANSSLFNHPEKFQAIQPQAIKSSLMVGPTFAQRAWFATIYYLYIHFTKKVYRHYSHHRPWTMPQETIFWLKSFKQKWFSKLGDSKRYKRFIKQYDKQFFLLPLQVEVDFQLREHSRFEFVTEAISEIMHSFAVNAGPEQALLIKHHPQNRGFAHYGEFIKQLTNELDLGDRVLYGHDFNLPDIYKHAKGVVTVNSTVGLSALIHSLPTIALGKAIYNIEGLTYGKNLDEFWQDSFKVDSLLFAKFRTYLCQQSQISGDFYKRSEKLAENLYLKINSACRSKK